MPDGVAGSGVGFDHRLKRVGPSGRGAGVGGEDRDGVGCCCGVEGPPEQFGGWPVVKGCGVEEGLEGGAGLAFPEPAGLAPLACGLLRKPAGQAPMPGPYGQ